MSLSKKSWTVYCLLEVRCRFGELRMDQISGRGGLRGVYRDWIHGKIEDIGHHLQIPDLHLWVKFVSLIWKAKWELFVVDAKNGNWFVILSYGFALKEQTKKTKIQKSRTVRWVVQVSSQTRDKLYFVLNNHPLVQSFRSNTSGAVEDGCQVRHIKRLELE